MKRRNFLKCLSLLPGVALFWRTQEADAIVMLRKDIALRTDETSPIKIVYKPENTNTGPSITGIENHGVGDYTIHFEPTPTNGGYFVRPEVADRMALRLRDSFAPFRASASNGVRQFDA
jgi:hypothetical protein